MPYNRNRNDADSVTFGSTVTAGSTGEDTFEVPADATIDRMQVRIYTGAELDLRLTPVIRPETGSERPIVKFAGGKSFIDGDDDFYEFIPEKPVRDNDEIVVKFEHTDGAGAALDYRVNIDLDYRGGLERAVDSIL